MHENKYIDRRREVSGFPKPEFQSENVLDDVLMDDLRKFTFTRLLDASKKYHMEKVQGKDSETLAQTRQLAEKLYSDYKHVKELSLKS